MTKNMKYFWLLLAIYAVLILTFILVVLIMIYNKVKHVNELKDDLENIITPLVYTSN